MKFRLRLLKFSAWLAWPLIFFAFAMEAQERPVRPNIIWIMADDLGYGDLSCYGNPKWSTPHLDRLAEEGTRLTQYYAAAPVCSPTRAALLTGRYPQRAGIPGVIYAGFEQNRHHGLQPEEWTVAEILKNAGYRTAIFGKWHLGYEKQYNPIRHGFHEFRGFVSGNIDYQAHIDRVGVKDWWVGDERQEESGYSTHLITRHSLDFIRRHRDSPFFLYVAHEAPHTPFQGPEDPAFRKEGRTVPERRSEAHQKRAYREMVQEMDRGVGKILETLKELKLEKRTFLFFCSDNGAARVGSNGSLRGHKGSLWEGGVRVPAIAWWPGQIAAGELCREPVMCIDLFPTALAMTPGFLPPEHFLDGVSLDKLLLQGQPLKRGALYWNYRRQSAVRAGDWKLLVSAKTGRDPKPFLFNLEDDPGEKRNVVANFPDLAKRLHRSLNVWKESVLDGAARQPEKERRPKN